VRAGVGFEGADVGHDGEVGFGPGSGVGGGEGGAEGGDPVEGALLVLQGSVMGDDEFHDGEAVLLEVVAEVAIFGSGAGES